MINVLCYALMEIQCTMRLKIGLSWLALRMLWCVKTVCLRIIQLFPKVHRAHDRSFCSMQWLQSFVTHVHAHIQVKSRDIGKKRINQQNGFVGFWIKRNNPFNRLMM